MSELASERSVELKADQVARLSVEPAGIYDAEKQLSPGQIAELKKRFRENEDLVPEVCTFIVIDMLLGIEEEKSELESRGGTLSFSTAEYETREDFAQHVGLLSASWAVGLTKAIELPSGEWPEGITPPVTFAAALEEMDLRAREEQRG